jgi:biotin operon repressor
MFYQRSLEIETRLQMVLNLVRSGRYSTPMIANQLGVSIPTVSRDVTALRERGHEIRAERRHGAWRYVLAAVSSKMQVAPHGRSPGVHYVSKRGRGEAKIA